MRVPPTPRLRPVPLPFDPNPPPFVQSLAVFPFRLDQTLSEDARTYLRCVQFPFRSTLSVLDLTGQSMVDFEVGPAANLCDALAFVEMLIMTPSQTIRKQYVWSISWNPAVSKWAFFVAPTV